MGLASRVSRLTIAGLLLGCGCVFAQEGLGDPTQPTSLAEPAAEPQAQSGPRWHLQSTLLASDRRLAVINGRAVPQGGRVDGATLLEVRRDGVTLEIGGQRINLRLWQDAGGVKRSEARAQHQGTLHEE